MTNERTCPFCGSDRLMMCQQYNYLYFMKCEDCGASGPSRRGYDSAKTAFMHRPGEETQ